MVVLAAIYDGVIFYVRWSQARSAHAQLLKEEAERARITARLMGGKQLRITNFYASPGVIRPGVPANLCYGVNGATKVRIEPPVGEVWPSLQHCLQVSPSQNTEYKLFAEDDAGHTATEQFTLRVER